MSIPSSYFDVSTCSCNSIVTVHETCYAIYIHQYCARQCMRLVLSYQIDVRQNFEAYYVRQCIRLVILHILKDPFKHLQNQHLDALCRRFYSCIMY